MTLSKREFAIRVCGLGGEWFRGPLPDTSTLRGRLFEPWTHADLAYVGGESLITETVGLGGMAAAAAFALQDFSAGTPEGMVELNLSMCRITLAENPAYQIPYLRYRGVPCGIDVGAVARTGIVPAVHLGATLRGGGHAGAATRPAPRSTTCTPCWTRSARARTSSDTATAG